MWTYAICIYLCVLYLIKAKKGRFLSFFKAKKITMPSSTLLKKKTKGGHYNANNCLCLLCKPSSPIILMVDFLFFHKSTPKDLLSLS